MPRRCLGLVVLFGLFALPALGEAPENSSIANMKKDIFFLASDECQGRGPGTDGINRAADYIVKQLTDAGLKPGGVDGGFFQPFTIGGGAKLEKKNELAFHGPDDATVTLKFPKDFQVMGLSGKGTVDAPLVFVGYGVQSKSNKLDEYAGVDVAGKIVVLLRHLPRWNEKEPFGGKDREALASLERKVATAEANKAAGVIVVNDIAETKTGDMIPPFQYLSPASPSKIPCVHVKREAIEPIIKNGLGTSLADVEKGLDEDLKPRSGAIKGWTAKLETDVKREVINVKNILGVLEGHGPLANEIVVVGAHYDHLGFGGSGSLAKNPREKQIHYGADDNGSGTTAMLELARRFGAMKDRQGRKLVFMAFSAEERGLLGSAYYCKHPLYPLADTAAMVNLDMVGKLRPDPKTKQDKLIVQGLGSGKGFEQLVDKLNTPGFSFAKVQAGMGPSDHQSFYLKKVPVLFFWTGTHPDYHKPSDTPDRINLDGMKKIVDYVETVIADLASDPNRPVYVEVKGSTTTGGPKGPKLGISPNYESDKEGLLIDGISPGGVAEKAGLKAGDRIVEIAGKKVTNIETYMVIMAQQKMDSEIEIGVVRDEKKLTLKAMLK